MAYGLKLKNAAGDIVLDENYRYNNNVMTGIAVIPAGGAGTQSPFIALSGANDPDRFLIFSIAMEGTTGYETIAGVNGFRFRRTAQGDTPTNIDYFVMRIG
jgi:hypothetical protein